MDAGIAGKIAKAHELKDEGNKFFKELDWKKALMKYHHAWLNIKGLGEQASSLVPTGGTSGPSLSVSEKSEVKALTETLHLNLAACYLRTEQYPKCIAACTTAIGVNDTSAKGYFRRGQAYLKVGNVDNAEVDLKKAANLSPADTAIRKELQKVGLEKKKQSQKQAKTFKGFFDKVELYDDKTSVGDAATELNKSPSVSGTKRERELDPDGAEPADSPQVTIVNDNNAVGGGASASSVASTPVPTAATTSTPASATGAAAAPAFLEAQGTRQGGGPVDGEADEEHSDPRTMD